MDARHQQLVINILPEIELKQVESNSATESKNEQKDRPIEEPIIYANSTVFTHKILEDKLQAAAQLIDEIKEMDSIINKKINYPDLGWNFNLCSWCPNFNLRSLKSILLLGSIPFGVGGSINLYEFNETSGNWSSLT